MEGGDDREGVARTALTGPSNLRPSTVERMGSERMNPWPGILFWSAIVGAISGLLLPERRAVRVGGAVPWTAGDTVIVETPDGKRVHFVVK